MGFFPFYTDIENKKCVIAGGGRVAAGKVRRLAEFRPEIVVIAPEISDEILQSGVRTIKRRFADSDIEGAFMVIGATDDEAVNRHISGICREKGIPVNIVDKPELCSFYFPAIVKKENVTIGISTEGKSPLFAKYLRRRFEEEIDGNMMETAEILGRFRPYVRALFDSEEKRKEALGAVLNLCLECKDDPPDDETVKILLNKIRCKYED